MAYTYVNGRMITKKLKIVTDIGQCNDESGQAYLPFSMRLTEEGSRFVVTYINSKLL